MTPEKSILIKRPVPFQKIGPDLPPFKSIKTRLENCSEDRMSQSKS